MSSTAPSRSSSRTPETVVAKPVRKADPAPAATEEVTAAPVAQTETASAPPTAAQPAAFDDAALLARPVRKGESNASSEPASPQSSLAPVRGTFGAEQKGVEVVPVSIPAAEPRVDGRFSS